MKKTLIITLVAFATLALAGSAFAQIAASHHDMGEFGLTTLSACEYCHTPHNAEPGSTSITGRTPLWNRINPANTSFTAYGTTVGGTAIANTQIGANSLTCLSCHDGVTAIGTTYNGGDTDARPLGTLVGTRAVIGQDLSDDHPVGFTAVDNRAGVPLSVFTNAPGGFYLYGVALDRFECASCHDPHDDTTGSGGVSNGGAAGGDGGSGYFLRADWGTICVDCHSGK